MAKWQVDRGQRSRSRSPPISLFFERPTRARRFSRDPSAIISYPGGWDENSVGANDPPIAGGRGRFSD